MFRRSTAAFALAGQFGFCGIAAGTTTTGGFDVVVLVQPPGCQFSSLAFSPGGAPTLPLVCSGNLFVEVQPTILTAPASATPTTSTQGGAFFSAGAGASFDDTRPATELTQSIASLVSTSDTRTSVGGAVFVQRRSSVNADSALTTGSSELTLDFGASSANTTAASPQPREILLIF